MGVHAGATKLLEDEDEEEGKESFGACLAPSSYARLASGLSVVVAVEMDAIDESPIGTSALASSGLESDDAWIEGVDTGEVAS